VRQLFHGVRAHATGHLGVARLELRNADTVVARLDALPALHAGLRPFARCFRTVAGTYQFEYAADDVFGLRIRDAGRLNTRTNLDALAA
jgi:hypothetical protein